MSLRQTDLFATFDKRGPLWRWKLWRNAADSYERPLDKGWSWGEEAATRAAARAMEAAIVRSRGKERAYFWLRGEELAKREWELRREEGIPPIRTR